MKKSLSQLLFLGIVFACLGIFKGTTHAVVSSSFIDTANNVTGTNTGAVSLDLEDTPSVTTRTVDLKLFIHETDPINPVVSAYSFCLGPNAHVDLYEVDAAGTGWSWFNSFTNTGPLCQGPNMVINGIGNNHFSPQYDATNYNLYQGWRLIRLVFVLDSGQALGNTLKFNANTSANTFITESETGAASSASNVDPGVSGFAAFGILGSNSNVYGYDTNFDFKPNCNAIPVGGSGTFYMKWNDADYGQSYGNNTSWQLIDINPNGDPPDPTVTVSGAALGSSKVYNSTAVTLHYDHTYRWVWHNVNHVNTLRLWMPFSEIQTSVDCSPPTPTPSCTITQVKSVATGSTTTFAPNERITFTVLVKNGNGLQIGVNGPAYIGQGDYGNYLVSGNQYKRAQITDIDGSNTISFIGTADGGPYNQAFNTPGSFGPATFNWGLIDSSPGGRGWVARCDNTFTVSTPKVTIQGSLLDADDVGAPRYGGITIETCTGQYPVTNINGSFNFDVDQGSYFCIRPLSQPAHTVGQYVRPFWLGYESCPGFLGNANPNYCSTYGTYEFQKAGVADPGNGFDRFGAGTSDFGYDIAFAIADTAQCSAITITNLPDQPFPNNTYRVTMSFVNTGGRTWVPGQWNAGYHGWTWPGAAPNGPYDTNNYLSNGTAIDTRVPWASGAVGPGGTATFQQDFTVPPWWTGANYPLEFRMVRDAGPPSNSGWGYWFGSPGSGTCATVLGVGQGTIFDTFNTAKKEAGKVSLCNSNGSTYSGVSGGNLGYYSFALPVGTSFCAGISAMDAGAPGRVDVYPYGEGYNTYYAGYRLCSAGAPCIGIGTYDGQIMSGFFGIWDRASNNGYDISVSSKPIVACGGIGAGGSMNVDDNYTGPVTITNNSGTPFRAPPVSAAVTVSVTPAAGVSPSSGTGSTPTDFVQGDSGDAPITAIRVITSGSYTFATTTSWSGGGYSGAASPECSQVVIATESPYLRIYGGDVIAGMSFSNPCDPAIASDVAGFSKRNSSGDFIGAGSQAGVYSNGTIIGMLTATLFTSTEPGTLAFANVSQNLAANPPIVGGGFGFRFCDSTYWPTTLPTATISNINAAAGGTGGKYLLTGGTLTQTGPITKSMTIYSDGDMTIASDLVTSTTASPTSWASPDVIPVLYVIAKGSIHIKPNVHQIDGLLVAEPTATLPTITGGRIYTCYNTNDIDTIDVANSGAWVASNCSSKLTIYGALIASKVNFMRTNGTARLGTAFEPASSPNIAETIQFTPELLMSTPALSPENTSDNFNSIIGLPPSL